MTFSLGFYKANIHNVSLNFISCHSVGSFCCSLKPGGLYITCRLSFCEYSTVDKHCEMYFGHDKDHFFIRLYTETWTEYQRMDNTKPFKNCLFSQFT